MPTEMNQNQLGNMTGDTAAGKYLYLNSAFPFKGIGTSHKLCVCVCINN